MTLGEKIRKLRQEQNISQKELAVKLDVSTADIAVWESDESIPSIADIAKLSSALGVTTDALIMDSEIVSDETSHNTKEEVVEKEIQPIELPSDKKAKVSKKKLAILIFLSVIVIAVIGVFAYNLFLPFSKNTRAIGKADESVVKIYCYDHEGNATATGSGFIAYDRKTVITNYHVIENAYSAKISTNQDISYDVADVYCYSQDKDIAILILEKTTNLKPLKLGDSNSVKKGATVIAIGSPLGIKNTVSQGILSGRLMENAMDMLQFTASISSGSSGGALFDDNGNVIGITSATYVSGQNLNLAIPINIVKESYLGEHSPIELSSLYMTRHKYLEYLDDYKYAPIVTLEELKQSPDQYKGRIIILEAYVYSVNDLNIKRFLSITDEANVGGDDVESLRVIYRDEKENYMYPSLSIGDRVIIIGNFSDQDNPRIDARVIGKI